MSTSKTALLLVASPRGFQSTSNSLGLYMLEKLRSGGFGIQTVYVQASMRSKSAETKMLQQVAESDLLILSFPLYIDCLPAPLISLLQEIAAQRKNAAARKPQRLVAIVNNGFPEATQNVTALAICRQFALEAGLEWAGGLSFGGGGVINGAALERVGFPARNIKKALDLVAGDLLAGNAVSGQAVELMAKPSVPRWLFLLVGNRRWNMMAKQNGVQDSLYDRTLET